MLITGTALHNLGKEGAWWCVHAAQDLGSDSGYRLQGKVEKAQERIIMEQPVDGGSGFPTSLYLGLELCSKAGRFIALPMVVLFSPSGQISLINER